MYTPGHGRSIKYGKTNSVCKHMIAFWGSVVTWWRCEFDILCKLRVPPKQVLNRFSLDVSVLDLVVGAPVLLSVFPARNDTVKSKHRR